MALFSFKILLMSAGERQPTLSYGWQAGEMPKAFYFLFLRAEGAKGAIAWGEALRSSAQPQD